MRASAWLGTPYGGVMSLRTDKRRWRWVIPATAATIGILLAACGSDDADPTAETMDDDSAVSEAQATPSPEPGESDAADADEADDGEAELVDGVYREYSGEAVADASYDTTVIFFHATWCPECKDFDESIEEGPVPAGVQILKADWDTEDELKSRYGLVVGDQTTFVKVDVDGNEISSWHGYNHKDRSIDNLLSELA